MSKLYFRTPKGYDGTRVTSHLMTDLIPHVLDRIGNSYHQSSAILLAMWPEIIGVKLAKMTEAVSFSEGILVVKVKNSTLHSLLSQNDKLRILNLLRKKFPQLEIKNISFRLG